METSAKIDTLKLQPEEVDGIYEIDIDEMINLLKRKVDFITAIGMKRQDDNSCVKEVKSVSLKDFVPHDSYPKAMEMLKRYLDGCRDFAA